MGRRIAQRTLRHRSVSASGVFAAAVLTVLAILPTGRCAPSGENPGAEEFHRNVQPILQNLCYDCHGDGAKKGGVAFDEFKSDQAVLENRDLWWKALRNLRAGLMPPAKKPQPTAEQKEHIAQWIKTAVFEIDPADPDPGRVTVRRLNRVEYRNTIHDLMGVEFNTDAEFPADDTGYGFDNIGDVLTLPPMLLEKYLAAAKTIVSKAVPAVSGVPAETVIPGKRFRTRDDNTGGNKDEGPLSLSYYKPASVSKRIQMEHAGHFKLVLDLTANEKHVENQFDYNKCRLVFKADGRELLAQEFAREGGRSLHYEFDQEWQPGAHELAFELEPLTPDQKQVRSLSIRIDTVTVRGPLEEKHWVRPKNYDRFFKGDSPKSATARRDRAREILAPFVRRAYRRPVDDRTITRLVALSESTWRQPGKTFEGGVSQAMVAVLASPRFLFREEGIGLGQEGVVHPLVDEYALASRLSYFLWSSMPDDELFRLAGEQKVRANLPAQVRRMLADPRSEALVRNFVGQWLQTRDIETVSIDARQVLAREAAPDPELERRRERFRELRDKPDEKLTPEEKKELNEARASFARRFSTPPRAELNGDLRRAMRQETEKCFDYVLHGDRSLIELIDSDYTFLNERLARHYGITNVVGDEMRLVSLAPDSPRGGILTQGTVLAVTSNPTRTSPVKRGLFILDNVLGTPPPPPPPDIPPLEDAAKNIKDHTPTLRETLALHREQPLCSSCHNRMDPLGLALENFNAMGMWRDQEKSQPIDAKGKLITGEEFSNIREMKQILATRHHTDFFRTITEKMLTYALGRGLEYYDAGTVDLIVGRLGKENGRPSVLLAGIIESAPFQKTRSPGGSQLSKPLAPAQQRADARTTP